MNDTRKKTQNTNIASRIYSQLSSQLSKGLLQTPLGKRIVKSILGIFSVFTVGTLYYWLFEGLPFLDALFFTGITISTVGYSMPENLSPYGRVFTLLLILVGLSFVLYSISYVTAIIVEGELGKVFKNKRIERRVSKMNKHVIVVGIGNIGTQVVTQLIRYEEVVAIDKNLDEQVIMERIPSSREKLVLINGDATSEETLLKAGIRQARALITTLPDDALNVFVSLTAKNLNSNIYVVSNITNLKNLTKFIYAGVDFPVATAEIASVRMVETVLEKKHRESVLDILNIEGRTFKVEVADIHGTKLVGKKIEELRLKEDYNLFIVGVLKNDKFELGPSKDYRIHKDDKLVIFGENKGLEYFRKDFLEMTSNK